MPHTGKEPLMEQLDLRVEQLDYAFVRECEDTRVLEKILRVLRSGEEGFYPHLIEYVEERLVHLKPDSRLLVRPQPPTRPQDLPGSELAALEADLAAWAADLRREEDEKKIGKRKEEEKEEEEEHEEEEEPTDLPPLDNIGISPMTSNKVNKNRKSRDVLTTITGGQKSPGSLIMDISECQVGHKSPHDLRRLAGGKKSPGSLIEVIDKSDDEESLGSKVTVTEKPPEPLVVSHVSGGSVIKVTIGHKGASRRQVESLLREAERQQAEGDLLSASLTYNKVLSVCPQQADARRALDTLLRGDPPPSPAAAATTAPPAATTPLVQEVE